MCSRVIWFLKCRAERGNDSIESITKNSNCITQRRKACLPSSWLLRGRQAREGKAKRQPCAQCSVFDEGINFPKFISLGLAKNSFSCAQEASKNYFRFGIDGGEVSDNHLMGPIAMDNSCISDLLN